MSDTEIAAEVPEEEDAMLPPERRLLLFNIDAKTLACEMAAIREIIPFQRITRLPGAPRTVCGLINLRGTIVTVLDLGERVAGKPCNRDGGSILLVPFRDKLVGVGVDEVRDLQSVPDGDFDGRADLSAFDAEIIMGLADVEGELVVILDIDAIVRGIFGNPPRGFTGENQ